MAGSILIQAECGCLQNMARAPFMCSTLLEDLLQQVHNGAECTGQKCTWPGQHGCQSRAPLLRCSHPQQDQGVLPQAVAPAWEEAAGREQQSLSSCHAAAVAAAGQFLKG